MNEHSILSWILVFSIAILSISSCDRKEEVVEQIDNNALLMNKKWMLTAQTRQPAVDLDGDGIPDQDVYAHRAPCMKDDFILYKNNNVFEGNAGSVKCLEEPQESFSTWKLTNNKIIVTSAFNKETTWEIVGLTSSVLHVKHTWTDSRGAQVIDHLTFTAQ